MSALYENDGLLSLTKGSLHPGGEALIRRAMASAMLPPGSGILDVGCGAGGTVEQLREMGYDAVGIDTSEKLVALANSPFVTLGNGQTFSGTYHGILLACVWSLLPDRLAFLSHAKKALLPGGKLILCEPYRKSASVAPIPAATCVNGLSDRADLFTLMEQAGFQNDVWMEEADALRSFLAMLIMAFGSADAFLCEMTGGCGRFPAGLRLGYAMSIWEVVP